MPAPDLLQAVAEQRQRNVVRVQHLTVEGQLDSGLRTVDSLEDSRKISEEHGWTGLGVMGAYD